MPYNANHRAHMHAHLARSTVVPYALARIRHLHPDWRDCSSGCGWPVDPAADATDTPTHPTCNSGATE